MTSRRPGPEESQGLKTPGPEESQGMKTPRSRGVSEVDGVAGAVEVHVPEGVVEAPHGRPALRVGADEVGGKCSCLAGVGAVPGVATDRLACVRRVLQPYFLKFI